ncbi:MAG: hypothetical protein GF417_01040 [Candidatus Latescibacteria bacterium]|nr:hypothetical protein [bacterium]MBD3423012.1 hypothetical protein [Candidatus Latescibacterota bacterium]
MDLTRKFRRKDADRNRPVLPLAGVIVALHFLLLFLAGSIPGHKIVFLIFFSTILIFPGYLLARIIFPSARPYYKLFLSLILGTAVIFACLVIFSIFGLDIYYLSFLSPVLSVLLALLADYGLWGGFSIPGNQKLSGVTYSVLLIAAVFVTVITLGIGDPVIYTSDSPDHIAYVRTVTRDHQVFPDRYIYKNGGSLTRDIRKGLFHAAWGAVNLPTGRIAVYPVWPLFSWIGSIFIMLGIFCLGIQFFRRQSIAALGVILYLLFYQGGQSGHQLIMNGFGFYFGKIFLFGLLIFLPGYLRTGKKELLFMIAVSSLAAVGTHISFIMIIPFGILVFSLFEIFQSEGIARRSMLKSSIPLSFAAVIAINLPYLLMRYFRDYNPANEIHTHVQGMLYLNGDLAVVNPLLFFQSNGFLMAVSLFSVFILWKRSRREKNLRLVLGSAAAVYILVFNPLWVPYIMDRITYLIVRFGAVTPTMLIAAYLIITVLRGSMGREEGISRWSVTAGWFVIGLFLIIPSFSNFTSFVYLGSGRESSEKKSALNLDDLYRFINREVPEGSIIASDPITSYSIPAFCDQFVVCTYDQHSTPNDSTALERIMDCRDIYLPSASCGAVADILDKYQAGYVVINGRIPASVRGDYWTPGAQVAEKASRRLKSCGTVFEEIYSSRSLSLLRYCGDSIRTSRGFPDSSAGTRERRVGHFEGDYNDLTWAETEGIYIRGWQKSAERIEGGDTLAIEIDWVADRKLKPGNYTVHVRFDTDFPGGILYRPWYGKVYRKLVEKLRGRRYRFRTSRLPFDGIYPPDQWPVDGVIRERLEVRIPHDITEGIYTVSVKMQRAPHEPNYHLKDFLTNDDIFDGPDLMKITIE